MASAIQWFLGKFNVNAIDAVAAFKDARVMCPVTVQWLGPTRATVEALRIFPFLDNDATIGGLVRELPQYIAGAATKDVVIECEGKKVEWWRVYVLSTTVALCQCAGFTSIVPDFLSLGRGVTKPKLKNS